MKNVMKKMLCAGLLVAMSFTALSTQAFAASSTDDDSQVDYSLVYSNSTSSYACILNKTFILESSGADQIRVQSNTFYAKMSGCYVKVECTNHETYNSAFISSAPGTATIEYAGDDSPKDGAEVHIYASLEHYIPSQYVKATGRIYV